MWGPHQLLTSVNFRFPFLQELSSCPFTTATTPSMKSNRVLLTKSQFPFSRHFFTQGLHKGGEQTGDLFKCLLRLSSLFSSCYLVTGTPVQEEYGSCSLHPSCSKCKEEESTESPALCYRIKRCVMQNLWVSLGFPRKVRERLELPSLPSKNNFLLSFNQ